MIPKVLITGSNYFSDAIRDALTTDHPEYIVNSLPRDDHCSKTTLKENAAEHDIVIHAGNPEDESVVGSLLTGMKNRGKNNFFIHLGGNITMPGIKMCEGEEGEFPHPVGESELGGTKVTEFGKLDHKVWSDMKDIAAIRELPKTQKHRAVDDVIFNARKRYSEHIHTAIVCPPDVYGAGHGARDNKDTRMIPLYCDEVSRQKSAIYVGRGENRRSMVHIKDLCKLYTLLVEEAARSLETGKIRDECWGDNGFYFASYDEEVSMRDISKATAKIMKSHGCIQQENPKSCCLEDTEDMIDGSGVALPMFGGNSRSRADRAYRLLGWRPQGPFFWEVFENDLINYKGNDPFRDYYPRHMVQVG